MSHSHHGFTIAWPQTEELLITFSSSAKGLIAASGKFAPPAVYRLQPVRLLQRGSQWLHWIINIVWYVKLWSHYAAHALWFLCVTCLSTYLFSVFTFNVWVHLRNLKSSWICHSHAPHVKHNNITVIYCLVIKLFFIYLLSFVWFKQLSEETALHQVWQSGKSRHTIN